MGELKYNEELHRSHLKDMLCAVHLCTKQTRVFGVKLSVLLSAALLACIAVITLGTAHHAATEGATMALVAEKVVEAIGEALAEVVE